MIRYPLQMPLQLSGRFCLPHTLLYPVILVHDNPTTSLYSQVFKDVSIYLVESVILKFLAIRRKSRRLLAAVMDSRHAEGAILSFDFVRTAGAYPRVVQMFSLKSLHPYKITGKAKICFGQPPQIKTRSQASC